MLKSVNVHEWNNSFTEANELISQHPVKLQLLKDIHSKSEYYSGYHTRQILCSLDLNGSTVAEINHSSVVAHLGSGGLMTIMDQVSQLLTRQQHLYNKERDIEISSIVSCHQYKSKFYGIKGLHDHEAKKNYLAMLIGISFRLLLVTVKLYLTRLIQAVHPLLFGQLDNSNMLQTVGL